MFLYCQPNTTSTGGGGGSTTINNYYYTGGLKNTANFNNYPVVSNHFQISGAPVLVGNNLQGNFIFTFNEEVIFDTARINAVTGAN